MLADSSQAAQFHPAWNSLSTALWVALIVIVILLFKRDIGSLMQLLQRRVKLGAGLKLGAFEIGQAYVEPGADVRKGGAVNDVRKDDGRRHEQREQYYQPNRLVMLVHRVAPSVRPHQLYDILIYLVPHPTGDATLLSVTKVDYYFGKSWGQNIFTSIDRAHGFAIATSAYGPFMCTAEIHFNDGHTAIVGRYIDFEMGALGAQPEPPSVALQ